MQVAGCGRRMQDAGCGCRTRLQIIVEPRPYFLCGHRDSLQTDFSVDIAHGDFLLVKL